MEIGKIPPQCIDMEKAVLGAILLESTAYLDVCDILTPNSFYKESHSEIYKAITLVFKKNNPIDILSISDELRRMKKLEEVGNYIYLSELTSMVASSSHIEFHARIIQQNYIKRELISYSVLINDKSYDNSDVNDLIDFAETKLYSITQGNINKEPELAGIIGKTELKKIEERSNSENHIIGIPTGFNTLDKIINGCSPNKLIIIAARPSMGKTTLIVSIAKNQSILYKKNIIIFSLEMGKDELWNKLISDITGITSIKIINGDLNSEEWMLIENAQRQLEMCNIYIDDTPNMSLMEIRAKSRRLKMKSGLDVIFIDYLQLMRGDSDSKGNREQQISNISRGLKTLSKELEVPVIALSQLNRSCELRPDKKPQLSDIRESGAIEQDADIVAFIHRPYYYGFMEYENGESTLNCMDIIISKNRGGKTGEINLKHTSNFSKVYDTSNNNDEIIEIDNSIEPNYEF